MSLREQADFQPRPATQDANAWLTYWKTQGQTWRTEPEIDGDGSVLHDDVSLSVSDCSSHSPPAW